MLKNKRFSLYDALISGFKILRTNITFFAFLWLIGVASIVLLFVVLSFVLPLFDLSLSFSQILRQIMQADYSIPKNSLMKKEIKAVLFEQRYLIGMVVPVIVFLFTCMTIGFVKIAFALHDKKNCSWRFLYQFYALVPRVFATWMIMLGLLCLLTCLGIVGCVLIWNSNVPIDQVQRNLILGSYAILLCLLVLFMLIFIYQRLRFATYFIIDKNLSVRNAFKSSWKLTAGSVLHLFCFSVVSMMLSILDVLIPIQLIKHFFSFLYFMFLEQANVSVFRQMLKK